MSDFTSSVSKQTFNPPVGGANRSSATGEPRVTTAVSNTGSIQDDIFEYADRAGANFPGALNSGWDFENLAEQSVRSLQLYPQEALVSFTSADKTSVTTAGVLEDYLNFNITTTFANAYIAMWWHRYFQANSGGKQVVFYEMEVEDAPGSGSYTVIPMNPLATTQRAPVIADSASIDVCANAGPVYAKTLAAAGTYNFKLRVSASNTSGWTLDTDRHTCYYRILNGQTS